MLLSCAPGEYHTLALDALFAALTEHQISVQFLGPSAPLPALLHAIEHTQPLVVFVWAQRTATAQPTALRRLVPHTTAVAAGPGWSSTRLPARVRWINSLPEAVALAREATPPDPDPV
ncbi:hypothetical protein LQ327_00525 [Actinomycetospora endophytica]|uniref:Cobalamin B12-binding domain-containing protein n=1 Tax=Actinomycetospora endophytica TaxID=2291215 RepID=A0ABS8P0U0_9PSEU|nr:hypothetical protein [Actinomycetospora endophytica]MCD2191873.1 hypothetical protein [Actinomycetospora endophytica]